IKERYVVSTPLGGRLLRIGLDVGDAVQAGETVLARIQPTDPELLDPRAVAQAQARVKAAEARLAQAQTQLEKANVSYDYAETEFARADRLADRGAITPSELEERRLSMKAAEQDVESARFAINIAKFEVELEQSALLRTQNSSDGSGGDGDEDGQFLIRAPISGR